MVALPSPAVPGRLAEAPSLLAEEQRLVLTGTLPVTPIGDRLWGTIEADGQEPKVTALATTPVGEVILLSLVGFDTSVSAALAKLYAGKPMQFQPGPEVLWTGKSHLTRLLRPYRQFKPRSLAGTRERHALSVVKQADIGEGLLHPPTFAQPKEQQTPGQGSTSTPKVEPPAPRYVLGNWNEATPERQAFLGHLRALRVIHLPTWADALWTAGLDAHLIEPLPALGVQCWRLEGHLLRWSALLTQGVQQGWLSAPAA